MTQPRNHMTTLLWADKPAVFSIHTVGNYLKYRDRGTVQMSLKGAVLDRKSQDSSKQSMLGLEGYPVTVMLGALPSFQVCPLAPYLAAPNCLEFSLLRI